MIEVEYSNNGSKYYVSLNGHADYADYGKDIVCASASMLIHSFAVMVNDYDVADNIKLEILFITDGIDEIEYEDTKGILDKCFEMLIKGLKDLSNNYPNHIKIVEK